MIEYLKSLFDGDFNSAKIRKLHKIMYEISEYNPDLNDLFTSSSNGYEVLLDAKGRLRLIRFYDSGIEFLLLYKCLEYRKVDENENYTGEYISLLKY